MASLPSHCGNTHRNRSIFPRRITDGNYNPEFLHRANSLRCISPDTPVLLWNVGSGRWLRGVIRECLLREAVR